MIISKENIWHNQMYLSRKSFEEIRNCEEFPQIHKRRLQKNYH